MTAEPLTTADAAFYPVAQPEPLTTEQAADFARRWVWWRRHELECAPLDLVAQEKWLRDNGPAERVLAEPDRERLSAWVRERMAGLGFPADATREIVRQTGLDHVSSLALAKAARRSS